MTVCLGVDVGLSGAIALVCSRRGLLEHANLPTRSSGAGKGAAVQRKIDAAALRKTLQGWSARHDFARDHVRGVIERMQPFGPGDKVPATTLLSMGMSAGIVEATLVPFCSEPPITVLPRVWKKAFGLANDKDRSVVVARSLFPTIGRIRHDTAEAILLAAWGLGEISASPAPAEEDDEDPFAVEAAA